MFLKLGTAAPLQPWGHYNPSQCWELLTQWHDIISQGACIINNTSVTIKKNPELQMQDSASTVTSTSVKSNALYNKHY